MLLHLTPSQLKQTLLDFLFPPRCIGCRAEGSFLCTSCQRSLPKLYPPFCERCGKPFTGGGLCPVCIRWPPTVEGIRSPFLYQGLIRKAIHHLKYKNLKVLAKPLGQLMAEYLSSNPLPADTLVPVPLHPKRIRQRGYNQSALLTREVGQILGLTVIEDSLIRSRNTASQITLSVEERRSNVRQAFECQDQRLRGKQIILIDDVCTTGSTLNACAATLKEIGAISIWGLTLTRET